MRVVKYGTRLGGDRLPHLVREMSRNYAGRTADSSDKILDILRDIEEADSLVQEKLWMFCLDNRMRLIGYFELFAGGRVSCQTDSSILFASALATGASSIILAHNHPSGVPTPSQEDVAMTKNIFSGAQLLGIRLEDHIIIGGGNHTSLRETYPDLF
jgi:DNA repair protein RadC